MWYKFITSCYDIYNYYYNKSLVIYLTDVESYSGENKYLYKVFSKNGELDYCGNAESLEEAKFKSLLKASDMGWKINNFDLKNNIDYTESKYVGKKAR